MILCIPTTGNSGIEEKVYEHFGSASIFALYNTETGLTEFVENSNEHHEHGGCRPAAKLEGYNVSAVFTKGIGARAIQKLNIAGIKVYMLQGETVADVIKEFNSGNIQEFHVDSACSGHNGCD